MRVRTDDKSTERRALGLALLQNFNQLRETWEDVVVRGHRVRIGHVEGPVFNKLLYRRRYALFVLRRWLAFQGDSP